jgi:hypothetical protein
MYTCQALAMDNATAAMERKRMVYESWRAGFKGQLIVQDVIDHKWVGEYLHVLVHWKGRMEGSPYWATWQTGQSVRRTDVYKQYCGRHGLPIGGYRPVD